MFLELHMIVITNIYLDMKDLKAQLLRDFSINASPVVRCSHGRPKTPPLQAQQALVASMPSVG